MTQQTIIDDASSDLTMSYHPCYFLDEEHEARSLCHALFGRMLRFEELATLCGGKTKKIEMIVGVVHAGLYLEYHDIPANCVGSCLIHRTADSQLALVNEHVRFLNKSHVGTKKFQVFISWLVI